MSITIGASVKVRDYHVNVTATVIRTAQTILSQGDAIHVQGILHTVHCTLYLYPTVLSVILSCLLYRVRDQ